MPATSTVGTRLICKESQDINKKEREAVLKGLNSRQNANMASEDL